MRALLLAVPLSGCASASRTWEAELAFDELHRVFGDVERGGLAYFGEATPADEPGTASVAVRAWAHGGTRGGAEERLRSSRWGVEVQGDLLDLWGRSPDPRAGVDLAAGGPSDVDVDLLAVEGPVEAHGVTGLAVLTGSSVAASGLEGSVDAFSTAGSAQVEVFPPDDGSVRVEAVDGDVSLYLPYGAPVDLVVRLDPQWGYAITDLGFDEVRDLPSRFEARTGDGTLSVEVRLTRGAFYLYEALRPEDLTSGSTP